MSTRIKIKLASEADITRASALAIRVFLEHDAPAYSDEGKQHFLAYAQAEAWLARHREGQLSWLAEIDGQFVGVLHLRGQNHVSMLFVESGAQRQGVGRALIEHAIAQQGLRELSVNSDLQAVDAYSSYGFEKSGPEELKSGIRHQPMRLVVKTH